MTTKTLSKTARTASDSRAKKLEEIAACTHAIAELIALHESAHAVMGLIVGLTPHEVRLWPEPRSLLATRDDPCAIAVAALAGPQAERLLAKRAEFRPRAWREGWSSDFATARGAALHVYAPELDPAPGEIADMIAPDRLIAPMNAWLTGIQFASGKLVIAHGKQIVRVASALYTAHSLALTGDEIQKAAGTLENISPSQLKKFVDEIAESYRKAARA